MKNSELRLLIAEYREIKNRLKKLHDKKLKEKLGEIEHRYFHETGRNLESEFREIK